MLSPRDFVTQWGKKDPLVRFRKKALERLELADADKEFLVVAGLPESAAPFLGFTAPKSGELPTVADQWDQPDEFRRYRVIGSNGSGDPIAIDDEQSGEVVHLDHEGDFARTFMNKTIRQLAESLLAYRNIVGDSADESSGEIPVSVRKKLHQALKKIDPAAMKPDCFWPEETQITVASADQPPQVLRDLNSPRASVRLKASENLERELRKAATAHGKKQFGNKNATSLVMTALDDPDPKVVHNAVVALAQITRNYFKDDRAYSKLLNLVHSKQPLTSRWAIDGLLHLRGEASLDDVLPLCTSPSQDARAAVFDRLPAWLMARGAASSGCIQPENQDRLRTAALGALNDDDRTVRGNAASLLGEIGDATALAALRKSLKKESYWLNEQIIGKAIERLEGRS